MTWADQFCKSRYSKIPDGPRDISLSCTAVAVLTHLSVRLLYAGWPSAEKSTTRVKDVALHMRDSVTEFMTVVQDLGSNRLPLGLLRCPLDICRGNPRSSSWQQHGLWDINVTKTAGLGDVLVRLLQYNPGNWNPVKVLLCDMHIWWRVDWMLATSSPRLLRRLTRRSVSVMLPSRKVRGDRGRNVWSLSTWW